LVDNPHDWLNHDVLELAGPVLIERQELYDFVVAELRLREGIGRKKIKTLRKALQNQRDDILGFAQVLDDKLAAILSMLKNPAYAGAFVYGRSRTVREGPALHQAKQKQLPQNEWRIRVNDKYPAYISWEVYEQIQAQLQENYAEYDRNKSRGIPRPGAALLHGLVYCGECGHKLVVQYKTGTRYICNYLRQQYRVPVCQCIPADAIDHYVVGAFFAALSPIELDAYTEAIKAQQHTVDTIEHAQKQQLERLRYQAALAERQYNQVDPDNRLVAAELEKRWESTLGVIGSMR
jgi:hypothetical protein